MSVCADTDRAAADRAAADRAAYSCTYVCDKIT